MDLEKYPAWKVPRKVLGNYTDGDFPCIWGVFSGYFPGTFGILFRVLSGYFPGTSLGTLRLLRVYISGFFPGHTRCVFPCIFPGAFPGTFRALSVGAGACGGTSGGALGALSGVPRFRIFRRLFGVLSAFPEVPGFLEVRQIRTLCIAGGRDETGETRWRGRTGEALGGENGPKSKVFGQIFLKIGHNSAPDASLELFSGLSMLISPHASVSGHQGAR